MSTMNNPWPGLASYNERNGMFCGRNQAINDLFSIICNNPAVTLYGRSGIGKTSLIKAGVAPLLRMKGYVPVYIRLMQETNFAAGESFADCIVRKLSVLTGTGSQPGTHGGGPAFLWDWFLNHSFRTEEGDFFTPVVFLDQFEETFAYDQDAVQLLLRQIYLLLDDSRRLPDDCDATTFQSRFRFVFSFRDDALYKMEEAIDSDNLGILKQNRYILKALKREQAREVIIYPAEDLRTGKSFIQPLVADKILDKLENLGGKDIDPAILSLLMSELYERMIASGQDSITSDFIDTTGNSVVRDFYKSGVAKISTKAAAFLEKELVTADGRRKSVSSVDLKGTVSRRELDILLEKHILSRLIKGRVEDYELSHDILCPIVMDSRRRRRDRRRIGRIARIAAGVCIGVGMLSLGAYVYWSSESETGKLRSQVKQLEDELHEARAETQIVSDSLFLRHCVDSAMTAFYVNGDIKTAYDMLCLSAREGHFFSRGQKRLTRKLLEISDGYCLSTGRYPEYWASQDGRYFYYKKNLVDVTGWLISEGNLYYLKSMHPTNGWGFLGSRDNVEAIKHIADDGSIVDDGYWAPVGMNKTYEFNGLQVSSRLVDKNAGNNMYRLLLTVEKLDTPRPKTQELMDFLDGNAFKFLDRSGSSRDLYKDCKNKD